MKKLGPKIKFYLSLYFPVRYYLRRDIVNFVEKYAFSGTALDLGCGEKPFQYLFKHSSYSGIDFSSYSRNNDFQGEGPDYFFDEEYRKTSALPFENKSFDNVVSFQVLEHHQDPEKMVEESARVTKDGGLVLLTFPFIGGLHEEPHDFQRWTHHKIKMVLEENNCEIIEVKKQGALWSVIAMLLNEQLNYFAAKNKFNYFISAIIYPAFLLFQYFNLGLDKIFPTEKIFSNYIVLARKK